MINTGLIRKHYFITHAITNYTHEYNEHPYMTAMEN